MGLHEGLRQREGRKEKEDRKMKKKYIYALAGVALVILYALMAGVLRLIYEGVWW